LPTGKGIANAGTILTAPTVFDIGVTVQMCDEGIPTASSSLTIVAPQRVHVPQVDVIIAPSTPACNSSCAISFPIAVASATDVEFPVVT